MSVGRLTLDAPEAAAASRWGGRSGGRLRRRVGRRVCRIVSRDHPGVVAACLVYGADVEGSHGVPSEWRRSRKVLMKDGGRG